MSLARRRHIWIIILCLSFALAWSAQAFARDHEPFYISFQVSNSTGTFPTCMNNHLTVAGYYTGPVGFGQGFIRDVSGKIQTFQIGSVDTQPMSINDRGEIAGDYENVSGESRGFVRSRRGAVVTFNPGGNDGFTSVTAINEDGIVAGYYATSNSSPTFGFLRYPDGGIVTFVAPRDASASIPWGLNNRGTTTGIYGIAGVGPGAFVRYRDGHTTTFDYALGIDPTSINDRGEVAGWYYTSGYDLGFVRSPAGKITPFDLPDQGSIEPNNSVKINAAGDVTGSYGVDDGSALHGFIRFCDGKLITFDPPKSTFTYATDINDFGVVTGRYYSNSAVAIGFLRIP